MDAPYDGHFQGSKLEQPAYAEKPEAENSGNGVSLGTLHGYSIKYLTRLLYVFCDYLAH